MTALAVALLVGGVSAANVLISDYNFQAGSILFSYLDGKGGSGESNDNIVVESLSDVENRRIVEQNRVSLVKIASANSGLVGDLDSSEENEREDSRYIVSSRRQSLDDNELGNGNKVTVQNNSFLSPATYFDESQADLKYGIVKYTVQEGDTPSSIATSFGISTYTVLWANNLKVGDYIRPGQVLEILPVSGVKHITKPGDTIDSIAKKYKADREEIIIFNDLPADGSLTEGKVLIIPNGKKEAPIRKPRVQRSRYARRRGRVISSSKYRYVNRSPKRGHKFPYGYCTWYVASRVYIPWGGHAKSWLANARAYGYKTGKVPVPGSVVVTNENRWYGHVAYVEAVHKNTITVSEMNYVGWGIKSVRVIPKNSPVIRGYIYVK